MSTRLSKLEQEQRDAKEHLQRCEEELMHAQSMGNAARIAQCQKWVAEATAICKGLGCNIEQQQK